MRLDQLLIYAGSDAGLTSCAGEELDGGRSSFIGAALPAKKLTHAVLKRWNRGGWAT